MKSDECKVQSVGQRPPVSRRLLDFARLYCKPSRSFLHFSLFTLHSALFTCLLTSPASAQTTRDTIAAVQPRVVKIFGAGGIKGLAAHGTGFFVSKEGHIATIWSHVLDADVVSVVLSDGRRFTARVLGAEPQLALAVLKLNSAEGLSSRSFSRMKRSRRERERACSASATCSTSQPVTSRSLSYMESSQRRRRSKLGVACSTARILGRCSWSME